MQAGLEESCGRNKPPADRSSSWMRFFLPALAALAACSAPPDAPEQPMSSDDPSTREAKTLHRYAIDASESRFTARVEVGGLLSMFGHDHTVAMREFAGEARFEPETLNGASLRLEIRADSVAEVGPEFGEEDRRKITRDIHEKALEVSKFPAIVFQSTGLSVQAADQVVIRGDLTLHGVTRPVSVPARIQVEGDRLTASGTFTIRHSDFDIERLSAAAGTVKAKDAITLTFQLVGRKE